MDRSLDGDDPVPNRHRTSAAPAEHHGLCVARDSSDTARSFEQATDPDPFDLFAPILAVLPTDEPGSVLSPLDRFLVLPLCGAIQEHSRRRGSREQRPKVELTAAHHGGNGALDLSGASFH